MRHIAASLALIAALALAALEVVALIDPLGTKLADDAEPYGQPIPWYGHLICVLLIAFFVSAAVSLLRRRKASPYPDVEPDYGPSGGYDPGSHDSHD